MRSTLKCDIMFHIIVGDLFMKTKIIYISGNETFEMAQIRAAFEEVRCTLGLGQDTILFGVPVDCDDSLAETKTQTDIITNTTPEFIPTTPIITDESDEPEMVVQPAELPETEIPEPVAVIEEPTDTVDSVVPILSVLAINENTNADADVDATPESEPALDADIVAEPVPESADITDAVMDTEPADIVADEPNMTDDVDQVVITESTVVIEDIADDSTPEMPMEKTLEQLLESMTPLREDIENTEPVEPAADIQQSDTISPDDTDATLAQLASEFALNEDKIASTPKVETSGKIGKLKNILPFKKAKREDSSLMGDLFGWAGIAANDEDFSLPGFFPQTASKK